MFHTREKDLKLEGEKLPEWILGSETELVNAVNQHE
jgi:hypothetical protein